MSLKMMAASSRPLYLRSGWIVISAASSGVWQISKNPCSLRSLLNSGRYLPACLITQTGDRGRPAFERAASIMSLFSSAGKLTGS